MASVFRRREKSRPVPTNAQIGKFRHGQATATWTDSQGRRHETTVERDNDGSLVRLSPTYFANFRDERGVIRTISTGMTNRDSAESFLNQKLATIEKIKLGLITRVDIETKDHGKRPIGDHVADFLRECPATLSPSRFQSLGQILRDFVAESGVRTLAQLNQESVEHWLNGQISDGKRGLFTLKNFVIVVHQFAKWCTKRKRMATTQGVEFVKVQTGQSARRRLRRAFTRDEFDRLMAVATPDWQDLMTFAVHTGLRADELRTLRCCDVAGIGTGNATIELEADRTKNGRADKLPCHPTVEQIVLRRIREHGLKPADRILNVPTKTAKVVHALCRRAGVDVTDAKGRIVDFHSLRGTFITWLATSGVDLRTVQQLARHGSIELTAKVYTDATQLPTRAAVMTAFGPTEVCVNRCATTQPETVDSNLLKPIQTDDTPTSELAKIIDVTPCETNGLRHTGTDSVPNSINRCPRWGHQTTIRNFCKKDHSGMPLKKRESSRFSVIYTSKS